MTICSRNKEESHEACEGEACQEEVKTQQQEGAGGNQLYHRCCKFESSSMPESDAVLQQICFQQSLHAVHQRSYVCDSPTLMMISVKPHRCENDFSEAKTSESVNPKSFGVHQQPCEPLSLPSGIEVVLAVSVSSKGRDCWEPKATAWST